MRFRHTATATATVIRWFWVLIFSRLIIFFFDVLATVCIRGYQYELHKLLEKQAADIETIHSSSCNFLFQLSTKFQQFECSIKYWCVFQLFTDWTRLMPCRSQWIIGHRPLHSIQLCLEPPPPSSSSCTRILLQIPFPSVPRLSFSSAALQCPLFTLVINMCLKISS